MPRDNADEADKSPQEDDGLNSLSSMEYSELRRIARSLLTEEPPDHSWGPTDLVHEAYLRVIGNAGLAAVTERRRVILIVAKAMRWRLVDHARQKRGLKRGGRRVREPLDDDMAYYEAQNIDVIALHEALEQLAKLNPRQAEVVELRAFLHCTIEETAELLGVSVQTVQNDYRQAKAYLYGLLGPGGNHDARTISEDQ